MSVKFQITLDVIAKSLVIGKIYKGDTGYGYSHNGHHDFYTASQVMASFGDTTFGAGIAAKLNELNGVKL